jgi:chloramphenicol-sensitive protein RarD
MKKGIAATVFAYFLWGFFPIYFHWLAVVPAFQIMSHRVVWSFFFVTGILLAQGQVRKLVKAITLRTALIYLAAGVLLGINWTTYVWAVNAGHVVETSLGYFINPLVSVMLGVVFLRERLRPLQWVPVALATAGVIYLTVAFGSLPWIALVLAFSFGLYGLMKKIAPLDSLPGVALETAMIFLPTGLYLIFAEIQGNGAFVHAGWPVTLLLILSGVVTAVPLLLFAVGAHSVPLSIMGLLQYISPTMHFIAGVFLFDEPFTLTQAIGFAVIWLALIVFSLEGLLIRRKAPALPVSRYV